jgi:nitroreductase
METMECIRGRASVREYKPDPVADSVLKDIMDAAVMAPSSGNVQDWEFVIVKTPEGRSALSAAAFNQGFVAKAPVVVVVCSDLERISKAYGERGKALYSVQNTSAAIQNLMLAAWDRGLGTCWIGAFSEEAVKEAVVLPTNVRPFALVTLGYPAAEPVKSRRKSSDRVTHWETF